MGAARATPTVPPLSRASAMPSQDPEAIILRLDFEALTSRQGGRQERILFAYWREAAASKR